jgi:hypothetical protein
MTALSTRLGGFAFLTLALAPQTFRSKRGGENVGQPTRSD